MSRLIELGEERVSDLCGLIREWDPESESVNLLHCYISEVYELISEMDQVNNLNRKLEEFIDLTSLPCAERFKARVSRKANYPIWACDHYGDCLVGQDADETEHIDDIDPEAA